MFGAVIDHWQRAGNQTQQSITLRSVIALLARLGAEPAAVLFGVLNTDNTAPPLFGADTDQLTSAATALQAAEVSRNTGAAWPAGAAMTDDDAVAAVTSAPLHV
jgi:hypothetical protein